MKKLISTFVIAALILSSTTFAFAGETTGDSTSGQTVVKEVNSKALERAEKLGIDVSGMTKEEAKAAIDQAVLTRQNERAEKLGIDISGMTREEAKAAIEEAVLAKMQITAEKLGVDISGLGKDEARDLLKNARAEKKAEKAAKQDKGTSIE
jgi:post-segregation antitoxin (ccd killing protein)